jgi:hypothetical protein
MAIDHVVVNILDETILALTILDLNMLQILEKRVSTLSRSEVTCSEDVFYLIQTRKRLLKLILQNYKANLDGLNRLHGRNMRDQWAH